MTAPSPDEPAPPRADREERVEVVAILWDFDKTLISGYMQEPLFAHYGVDPVRFWDEVAALPRFHAASGQGDVLFSESIYLNHILGYVRAGRFAGLDNAMLRRFGALQRLAPGVPDIFERTAALGRGAVRVEHYVVSTGLRQIILGSAVAPHARRVWGCELLERVAPPGFLDGNAEAAAGGELCDIGYVIDNTTKTRAIFEVNKGVGEIPGVGVDTPIPRALRRVPFENMIYVADGPSDVPSWSVINERGGRTFGVYQPGSPRDLAQAQMLLEQGRVQAIGPADYRPGSETSEWLLAAVGEIAERLARNPRARMAAPIPPTPAHIYKP